MIIATLKRALERVQPAFFDASVARHHKDKLKLHRLAQFVGLLTCMSKEILNACFQPSQTFVQ